MNIEVAVSRRYEMIPNEDGSEWREHLLVDAIATSAEAEIAYAQWLDVGLSEVEKEPFFEEKIVQMEKLAEMAARRGLHEALKA